MAIAAFNTSSLEAVRAAIDAAEATGGPVPAEFIVNLGLLAHAEGQVFILQALVSIFMDDNSCAEILDRDTPGSMVETMVKFSG